MGKLDDKALEALKPGSTRKPDLPEDMFVPRHLGLTRADARIIAMGLLADGLDVDKLTPEGRQEIRDAIDKLLK